MKRILFPTDFSPQCDAMAPAAAALARRFGAQLTVMHVLSTAAFTSDLARFEHHYGTLAEEVRGKLEAYHREGFADLDVDRVFKIGRPVDEIVAHAASTLAELIVMPTHGRSPFRDLLLGSVTAGVLHDSESAVLTTVHAAATEPWRLPKSILCAIDTGPRSADVLDMADHFALHCEAKLRVVHAVTGDIDPQLDLRVEDARARYPEFARYAETRQELEIINGESVIEAILAAAARADLLVVGRGQSQGVLGRLRSGVHELIRRSPCPVLSV